MRVLVLSFLLAAVASTSFAQQYGCDLSPLRARYLRVNLTVWVQPDVSLRDGAAPTQPVFSANKALTVPDGADFYQLLQIAQVADDTFRFDTVSLVCAPKPTTYLRSINDYEEVPEESKFWKIYELTEVPDFETFPPEIGPHPLQNLHEIKIKDGKQYVAFLRSFPATRIHQKLLEVANRC